MNKKHDKLPSLADRVKSAGDKICEWWRDIEEKSVGHWDQVGYRQGLRDALEVMKRYDVIESYSITDGVVVKESD